MKRYRFDLPKRKEKKVRWQEMERDGMTFEVNPSWENEMEKMSDNNMICWSTDYIDGYHYHYATEVADNQRVIKRVPMFRTTDPMTNLMITTNYLAAFNQQGSKLELGFID